MSEWSTDWAFGLLRPILQELKVQKLSKNPCIVRASAYKDLVTDGMKRWVIIARQSSMYKGTKGFAEIVFSKTYNLFFVLIFVDENLFANNNRQLRTQRKMVAIHEFVHGSAHMFLSAFLKSDRYIEFMDRSIIAKMKMTTSSEFNEMLSAIGKLGTKGGSKHEVFTDGHFRLLEEGYKDGFDGNFAELYTYLLLSYQLVCETMTAIKIQHETTGIGISELLTHTFNELVDKKALDEEFVLGRMKLFLPMLYERFA